MENLTVNEWHEAVVKNRIYNLPLGSVVWVRASPWVSAKGQLLVFDGRFAHRTTPEFAAFYLTLGTVSDDTAIIEQEYQQSLIS